MLKSTDRASYQKIDLSKLSSKTRYYKENNKQALLSEILVTIDKLKEARFERAYNMRLKALKALVKQL